MMERLDAEEGTDLADYLKSYMENQADSSSSQLSPVISGLQRMEEANPALKSLVEVFGFVPIRVGNNRAISIFSKDLDHLQSYFS